MADSGTEIRRHSNTALYLPRSSDSGSSRVDSFGRGSGETSFSASPEPSTEEARIEIPCNQSGVQCILPHILFFVTVYPIPDWPYNITPYYFLALLLVGIGYMYWIISRDPEALVRGATTLVGRPIDDAGDVEWAEREH